MHLRKFSYKETTKKMRIGKRNLKIEKMRKKEIKKMKGKKIKTWFSRHIKRLFCYIFVFYGSFLIFLLTLPP